MARAAVVAAAPPAQAGQPWSVAAEARWPDPAFAFDGSKAGPMLGRWW